MSFRIGESVASALSHRFGIALAGRTGSNDAGSYFEVYPSDIEESESFKLQIRLGWHNLEGLFLPGSFSAPLIQAMGRAGNEQRSVFKSFADSIIKDGGRIVMTLNGSPVLPLNEATWAAEWHQLSVSFKKSPIDVSQNDTALAVSWTGRFLGMFLALAPTEEIRDEPGRKGQPEGNVQIIEVTRYERSRLNRAACLQLQGTKCLACGFDFADKYGPLGEGFIHVHHVVPVSEIGTNYVIDPSRDLIPLCANCHSMIHLKEVALTLEQLQNIIEKAVQQRSNGTSETASLSPSIGLNHDSR